MKWKFCEALEEERRNISRVDGDTSGVEQFLNYFVLTMIRRKSGFWLSQLPRFDFMSGRKLEARETLSDGSTIRSCMSVEARKMKAS